MKINTYGRIMKNLKKVSSETKSLEGYYSGKYLQLNYDISTGELWTNYHYSLGQNSWSVYHNENVIVIGNISLPQTMQNLADMIAERMAEYECCNIYKGVNS